MKKPGFIYAEYMPNTENHASDVSDFHPGVVNHQSRKGRFFTGLGHDAWERAGS
jgi:hypothetical protein